METQRPPVPSNNDTKVVKKIRRMNLWIEENDVVATHLRKKVSFEFSLIGPYMVARGSSFLVCQSVS